MTYTFSPPITLPAGATSFFAGDMSPQLHPPELYFQSLDQDSSLHRQSWVAAKSDGSAVDLVSLGNNDFLGLIDDFGLPGNWLIRADTAATGLLLQEGDSARNGFLVPLPLLGPSGVEDRSLPADERSLVIMRFNHPIVSVGSVTASCGQVQRVTVNSENPYQVNVALRRLRSSCSGNDIAVTANNVTDDAGDVLATASVTTGYLIGDVNGDRVVDRTDVAEVRDSEGQLVSGFNFRDDVNGDGIIDAADLSIVKHQLNSSLP